MPTILLTGANRGLGLQFAGQYAADGWRVIATCRDPANAADLKAVAGQVEVHVLDVTDFKAIEALAVELIGTPIDILLNNAGIIGPDNHNFGDIDYDGWADTFRVNAMAPMKMVECFIDHVAASERKMIVSISSKLASMVENTDGGHYIYRSSKAALNAVHMSLANDLADRGIASVVFHPGWARTSMGGPRAPVDPGESVTAIRSIVDNLGIEDSGRFVNYDGQPIDW